MKALTIWQPFASLIMIGAKPFEFRTWDYRLRHPDVVDQRIVIHASVRPIRPPEVFEILQRIQRKDGTLRNDVAMPLLERLLSAHKCEGVLELGAALGTAVIGRPRKFGGSFAIPAANKTVESMWAWPLGDVKKWHEPVPMNGAQGFWNCQIKVAA